MAIDLGKRTASGLRTVVVDGVGVGGRGAPSLLAVPMDERGTLMELVSVWPDRPEAFSGALRMGTGSGTFDPRTDVETLRVELAALPVGVAAIGLCLAHDERDSRVRQIASEVAVRILDGETGSEATRHRIVSRPGSIVEFGRLVRGPRGWDLAEGAGVREGTVGRTGPASDAPAGRPDAVAVSPERPSASPPDIATAVSGAYCDVATRRSLVRRVAEGGIATDEAEVMVDLELERLRIANEAVLIQRLDAVLRRFTDSDRKLDDKERRDALQMVCRASPGCDHGLRHDVADRYVVQFCRERSVKVRTGLLRWAVP